MDKTWISELAYLCKQAEDPARVKSAAVPWKKILGGGLAAFGLGNVATHGINAVRSGINSVMTPGPPSSASEAFPYHAGEFSSHSNDYARMTQPIQNEIQQARENGYDSAANSLESQLDSNNFNFNQGRWFPSINPIPANSLQAAHERLAQRDFSGGGSALWRRVLFPWGAESPGLTPQQHREAAIRSQTAAGQAYTTLRNQNDAPTIQRNIESLQARSRRPDLMPAQRRSLDEQLLNLRSRLVRSPGEANTTVSELQSQARNIGMQLPGANVAGNSPTPSPSSGSTPAYWNPPGASYNYNASQPSVNSYDYRESPFAPLTRPGY